LQRRAHLAFAELPTIGVGQGSPEILGFANDAGIAHTHELVPHLERDALERAVDDRCRHRIDAVRRVPGGPNPAVVELAGGGHAGLPMLRMRLPTVSRTAIQPGGTTAVLSFCSTTAGPERF
jgi:hypothetical protein